MESGKGQVLLSTAGVAEDVPLMKEKGGGREISPEAEANQNNMLQASLKEVLGKFLAL